MLRVLPAVHIMTNGQQEPYQFDRAVATIFDYEDVAYEELHFMYLTGEFTYLIVGFEICPDTGRPHLQCYMEIPDKKTRSSWKKMLTFGDNTPWFECARGDTVDAIKYCKKGGDFVEFGTPRTTQARGEAGRNAEKRRWNGIYEAMNNCESEAEFIAWCAENLSEKDFAGRLSVYLNTFNKIQRVMKKPQGLKPEELTCEWFMGPPGTGKSRTAREENPGAYVKMPTGKWFDDYDGEKCVIIDDLDHHNVKNMAEVIKQLSDLYPVRIEVKGSSKLIRPTKVIVTSNYSISTLFPEPVMTAALSRRFTIRKFLPNAGPAPGAADAPITIVDDDAPETDAGAGGAGPSGAVLVPPAAFW